MLETGGLSAFARAVERLVGNLLRTATLRPKVHGLGRRVPLRAVENRMMLETRRPPPARESLLVTLAFWARQTR